VNHLVEIEAFVAVVREGGFSAAADVLGVSSPYVSKLVTRLESRLGVQLLVRTTRSQTVTDAGQDLYERSSTSLTIIAAAMDEVAEAQSAPRGRLRITLPTSMGGARLADAMATFMCEHRGLALDLVYTDTHVDLVSEGFDAALRAGDLRDSTLIARRIAVLDRLLVASPAYLERQGEPETPEDLRRHDCLIYAQRHPQATWHLTRGAATKRVAVDGAIVANFGEALTRFAASGLGIALLPEFYVSEGLNDGSLTRVLPEWTSGFPLSVVMPPTRHVPVRVRLLVDFLKDHFASPLWPATR